MNLVIVDPEDCLYATPHAHWHGPGDWQPVAEAMQALARLNQAGHAVVLAASYPGLGGGQFDMATLNAAHAQMHRQLAAAGARAEAVFFCPHTAEDDCDCRPPRPGLLQQIATRFRVTATQMHVVSCRETMLQAARSLGCRTHAVCARSGVPETGLPPGTRVHASLAALVDALPGQAAASSEPDLSP